MVWSVFQGVSRKLVLSCIHTLFEVQSELDALQWDKLSVPATYAVVSRSTALLEELFKIWVVDDDIAREVALQSSGFDYLINKMNRQPRPRVHQLFQPVVSTTTTNNTIREEEEFANSIKLVPLPG